MMKREKALEVLHKYISNDNMRKHCLASEVVMRAIAKHLGENEDIWGLTGLLHDIDVEITHADAHTHGTKSAELISELNLPTESLNAILMHNEMAAPRVRQTPFEHALAAGETITGLIMATAMVYPDKKLSSVKTKSIVKRMKEKNFAASVKRENILECEKIGISLDQFAEMSLNAMISIDKALGL